MILVISASMVYGMVGVMVSSMAAEDGRPMYECVAMGLIWPLVLLWGFIQCEFLS